MHFHRSNSRETTISCLGASRVGLASILVCIGLYVLSATTALADAKSALPASIGDFKLTGAIQTYSPSTLENHVDGEAEAIKHYDFKECAYGVYAPGGKGNQLITVDIYQMADATNAYGYYSSQRNPSATIVKFGAEGYQESTALNFWKGASYVKISITAANPASFQPMLPKIAAAIVAKLSGSTSTPPIVKLLPAGYSPRTEQYRKSDIFAQSYINNGMVAKYPSAGSQAELCVAIFPNPLAAKNAFAKYQAYLSKSSNLATGAKLNQVKGLGETAVEGKSKFTGEVLASLKGKYLIAVRKAKDLASAKTLAKSALANAN